MSEPEPLLSELCTICHITPPKYRCPRCSIRTCSLACTRRHKNWSQCSGVRDPAAYAPRAQLETAGALDRDFNFITGIERGLERAEREARARGFELEHGYMLDPKVASNNKRKRGGNYSKEDGSSNKKNKPVRGESAFLRAANEAGVRVERSPRGMTRNKQNKSRVHPKHKCLSWTVDWIHTCGRDTVVQNYLETITISQAYDRAYPPANNETTSLPDKKETEFPPYRNVYFYIRRNAYHHIVLAPLHPDTTLADALRGRTVYEHPRLYVLPNSPTDIENGDVDDESTILEKTWLRDHSPETESDKNDEDDFTSSEGSSSEESEEDDESESEVSLSDLKLEPVEAKLG